MKKMIAVLSAMVICGVGVAQSAMAETFATLNVVGFSQDGKYFAFEEYGISDGTAAPFSSYRFIDVATDRYVPGTAIDVLGPEGEGSDEDLAQTRGQAANRAAATLRRLGIRAGNVGRRAYPATAPAPFTSPADPDRAVPSARFSANNAVYNLNVVKVNESACEESSSNAALLKLTLTNTRTGATKVLAQDSRAPASRGCVIAYGISQVYVYNATSFVTFLNVFIPDFGGPSVNHMVVSGSLN